MEAVKNKKYKVRITYMIEKMETIEILAEDPSSASRIGGTLFQEKFPIDSSKVILKQVEVLNELQSRSMPTKKRT